jgi:hypothetical protein
MKRGIGLLMALFLITTGLSVQSVNAQTKTKEEQQAELKLQQEIDQQKKEMVELQKAFDEQSKVSGLPLPANNINGSFINNRSIDMFYGRSTGDQSNSLQFDRFTSGRTSWDFSKSVTEATFTKEYGIDVDKGSRNVQLSISGACKTGEIRVTILMPGGKPYSEAVIDEFGNLNWRKSFQVADDNTDKIGEWKFKINARSATGNFNISLQVN